MADARPVISRPEQADAVISRPEQADGWSHDRPTALARRAGTGSLQGMRATLDVAIRRTRWSARNRLAERGLYIPLARVRHRNAVLARDTELVIDGFPRTANTFALIAFQVAQRTPVRVAHHLHAPAQLILAARLGIPALVTIREPEGTVLSNVIREPHVRLGQALDAYTRFYERLLPHRHAFVVADFPAVTTDFGAVIDLLNSAFGTAYARFEHTPDNVADVFRLVEDRARRPCWGKSLGAFLSGYCTREELQAAAARAAAAGDDSVVPELRVSRPSDVKEDRKRELRDQLADPSLAPARERARAVYEVFRQRRPDGAPGLDAS
jgi:hypothetical protein